MYIFFEGVVLYVIGYLFKYYIVIKKKFILK